MLNVTSFRSKALSIIVSVVLVVGLMPLPAYAGEQGADSTNTAAGASIGIVAGAATNITAGVVVNDADPLGIQAENSESQEDGLSVLIAELEESGISFGDLDESTKRQLEIMARYAGASGAEDARYPVELTGESAGELADGGGLSVQQDSIPAAYDSRTRGIVTPVRNQGDLGLCWSFAMTQSAETSWAAANASAQQLNLSEWQLAYFAYNRPVDPLSNTVGDVVTKTSGRLGNRAYYDTGNTWLATFNLANGVGFADESTAPYDELVSTINQAGYAFLNDDKCYHADSYVVDQKSQPGLIKQMIMEHGAGTLFFSSATASYNLEKGSYFNLAGGGTGHIVTVVGWDDNYSRENFGGVNGTAELPTSNGAWLAKNSWGDNWGNAGYFWISYEEPSLGVMGRKAVFYDIDSAGTYDHQYFYDGTMSVVTIGDEDDSSACFAYSANVFTAKQNETIKAIGFYTADNDTDYEVSIYKNPDADNPASGQLVASGITGSKAVPGYHREQLNPAKYVSVDKGDRFSVVVKETKANKAVPLFCDMTSAVDFMSNTSVAHAGESFVSRDAESWLCVSEGADAGNMRIKAFTTVNEGELSGELAFQQSSYELAEGKPARLSVLLGDQEANEAMKLTFASSDSAVVRVDDLGNVYPQAKGSAQITVRYQNQEAICNVSVVAAPVQSIDKADGYATADNPVNMYLGETVHLSYGVTPSDYDVALTWSAVRADGSGSSYGYSVADGAFTTRFEGLYKVTGSYVNASGVTVKQDFYIRAGADSVECNSAETMRYNNYENSKTRSYLYTGDPNDDGYVLTFAEDCSLETGYDYVYLLTSNSPITGQMAYNNANGWYVSGVNSKSYTGKELAGATVLALRPYFALVLRSDSGVSDWGFAVTSIADRIAPTDIDFASGIGESVTLACGSDIAFSTVLSPEGAYDDVAYQVYDPVSEVWSDATLENGIVRIEGGRLYAQKVGQTRVRAFAVNDTSVQSRELQVVVQSDEPPTPARSGTWGSCQWEISDEGVLTVEPGTGAAPEGSYSPWYGNAANITSVVFASANDGADMVVAPADSSCLLQGLSNVATIDLSGLDTAAVENMDSMFAGCSSVESLDLSGFNTAEVTSMDGMFSGCSSLGDITVGSSWSVASVTSAEGMFTDCASLVGGYGTAYDADHVDEAYAHVDSADSPGYFTSNVKTDLSTATVTSEPAIYLYTGEEFEPAVTVEFGGSVLPAATYDVAYLDNAEVGTATITVTGKRNFTGSATGSFKIIQVVEVDPGNVVEPDVSSVNVAFAATETGVNLTVSDVTATASEAAQNQRVSGVDDDNFKVFDVTLTTVDSNGAVVRTLDGEGANTFGTMALTFDLGASAAGKRATVKQIHGTGASAQVIDRDSQTVPASGKITISGVDKLSEFAVSTETQYTVKFDAAGGSAVAEQAVVAGSAIASAPSTSRSGYSFGGWTLDGAKVSFPFTPEGNVTLKASWTKNATPVTPSNKMHRLYNPYSGEHFYTASDPEKNNLVSVGWTYEGIGWNAPTTGTDVHRLYNRWTGDHHFTTSVSERDTCVAAGWTYEGVGWKSGGSKPVYREYNPYADAFYHNYTANASEHSNLISVGWRDEGVGWYGV